MAPLGRQILSGGIANINVGPDEVPFDAHYELLCDSSPFFDNALNGRFLESETKVIPLPDDDPDTFAEFLCWLYRGKLFESDENPGWMELSRLWVMADKFGVPDLQNDTMRLFPVKFKGMTRKGNIHPAVLDFVYENTVADSPLRRITVDVCTWGMEVEKFERHRKDMPAEFLEDFGLMQMKKNSGYYKGSKAPFETYLPRYFVKNTSNAPETPPIPSADVIFGYTTQSVRSPVASTSVSSPATPATPVSGTPSPAPHEAIRIQRKTQKITMSPRDPSERRTATPHSRISRSDMRSDSGTIFSNSRLTSDESDLHKQVEALTEDIGSMCAKP